MKKVHFLILALSYYALSAQTVTGILNSGAISDSNYMHSIGEIYVINTNVAQNNSGIITILNRINDNTLSINDIIDIESIGIFPNPTTDVLHVRFRNSERPDRVFIYNTLGQKIIDLKINTENLAIITSNLPNGMYVLQFSNYLKKSYKIIKQ